MPPRFKTRLRHALKDSCLRRPTLIAAALASLMPFANAVAAEDDAERYAGGHDPVVYVESNVSTPDRNSILAFRVTREGELRALEGSPFLTHGTGIIDPSLKLGPFDADQQVITNPERTLLFAVNSGSNTIAVFYILPDGSLVDVDDSPFPSGGSNPVSVGLSRDTLVVVNKAMDPKQSPTLKPNYTTLRIMPDGKLVPVPLSSVSVAVGASPAQALISPSKRLVFGADFLGGELESFQLSPNGELEQNLPQTLPSSVFDGSSAPHLPLGLAAHPNRPVIYVGLVTINKVAVYTYDLSGQLSFVRAVANSGIAPCWVVTNDSGDRIYTADTTDNAISVYDTTEPLKPVQIQRLILKGEGNAFELGFAPSGRILFALSQRATATTPLNHGNVLHALRVERDGRLVETVDPKALQLPAGTRPQGVATF